MSDEPSAAAPPPRKRYFEDEELPPRRSTPLGGGGSTRDRARQAEWALLAYIAAAVAVIAIDVAAIGKISDFIDAPGNVQLREDHDDLGDVGGAVSLIGLVLAAVFWIRWFQPLWREAKAQAPDRVRWDEGQAAWSWLVPFFNWVRPKQMVDDLVRVTGAALTAGLLWTWWALWIVGGWFAVGPAAKAFDREDPEEIRDADVFDAIQMGLGIAGALLAIIVLRRLTAAHARQAARP